MSKPASRVQTEDYIERFQIKSRDNVERLKANGDGRDRVNARPAHENREDDRPQGPP